MSVTVEEPPLVDLFPVGETTTENAADYARLVEQVEASGAEQSSPEGDDLVRRARRTYHRMLLAGKMSLRIPPQAFNNWDHRTLASRVAAWEMALASKN